MSEIRYCGEAIWSPKMLPSGLVSRYMSDFEELGVIGCGGYGIVVKCKNRLDNKVYAMKKIPVMLLPYETIKREVLALSSMDHPNIVRYYTSWIESSMSGIHGDFVLNSPCMYLQMELCRESLASFLLKSSNEDVEDVETRRRMLVQIVRALAHIHEKDFIHRDICPGNIFLDENKIIKIGDFGLAKFLDGSRSDRDSNSDGQKLYMAPEREHIYSSQQIFSFQVSEISAKADIFSLGLVLAELWYPFDTKDERNAVLRNLKQSNMVQWNWTKTDSDFILKLMAKNPEDRPTAKEILEELQAHMSNEAEGLSCVKLRSSRLISSTASEASDKQPSPGLPIDLTGKRAFVTGIADDNGYGWAIAKSLAAAGAEILVGTQVPALDIFEDSLRRGEFDKSRVLRDGSLMKITKVYPLDAVYDCSEDVPEDVKNNKWYAGCSSWTVKEVAESVKQDFGTIDILVHSLASGPEISKPLLETSRFNYLAAVSASSYSFVSLLKHFIPIMKPGGSTISLTYIASERIIPGYGGGMSSAKAALESDTKVLAFEAGRKHDVRVNAISVGPLRSPKRVERTNDGFTDKMIRYSLENAPLQKELTAEEVGNTAAFLASPLASAISGAVIYVDNGLNAMGVGVDSPVFRPLDISSYQS